MPFAKAACLCLKAWAKLGSGQRQLTRLEGQDLARFWVLETRSVGSMLRSAHVLMSPKAVVWHAALYVRLLPAITMLLFYDNFTYFHFTVAKNLHCIPVLSCAACARQVPSTSSFARPECIPDRAGPLVCLTPGMLLEWGYAGQRKTV